MGASIVAVALVKASVGLLTEGRCYCVVFGLRCNCRERRPCIGADKVPPERDQRCRSQDQRVRCARLARCPCGRGNSGNRLGRGRSDAVASELHQVSGGNGMFDAAGNHSA